MFHYTVEVDKSLDEAVSALEASLKNEKFGVLWSLNMKETLAGKGVELDGDYIILEVCNPHEAKRVLEKSPLVSYFLPCKIVVYKEDGSTKVGLPKPTELIKFVENEELQAIASDIEHRLIGAIDSIK
ncbi:DUF302 domain-containing protein [Mesobacillus subterraneus]|uniref:DUF302 domain-containing protein n=1 Tax=Mesobacillus subterraneus TaxID=285983 RepID=A0A427TXL0_9BACI|nr:DUF302 domain-containing protein [Mesobacillus subterraneus]RSD29203.1 DUF302 domain-containing protein [Mesobacillus subterraneus]